MAAQQPHPVPVGVALGLGRHWVPGPSSWTWHKADVATPAGPQTLHVCVVEDFGGQRALAFTPDDLRAFIDLATKQLTGLDIARTVPYTPPNGAPH